MSKSLPSAANPSAAVARIILGEAPYTALAAILPVYAAQDGRVDAEQVRSWAMGTTLDLGNQAEVAALLAMVPAANVAEVFAEQARRSKQSAERKAALRITQAESGRVVLNGIKLMQSDEGKGGMPFCVFPRELLTIVDSLPMVLQSVVDTADTTYPANEVTKSYNPAYDALLKAGRKAGKSDDVIADEAKKAGVAKLIEQPHKRAGRTMLEWAGVDKAAAVSRFRAVLEALRGLAK